MRSKARTHIPIRRDDRGRRKANPRLLLGLTPKTSAWLLGGLAVALLLTAAGVYISIYSEGDEARRNAQDLLTQYNMAASRLPSASPAPASPAASAPAAATGTATAAQPTPTDGDYVQPDAPEIDPKDALISVPGYDVIGKLRIEAIDVELPVIAKTTDKALKISVCYYGGAQPGEKGNMIITGHNYKNGAHFGRLDRLKAGDAVIFDAPGGKVYRYEVTGTQVIKPDDVEAVDEYDGEYALTLLTCASSGNRRLVVRCRRVE